MKETPTREVLFHRDGFFYPITAFQDDDWGEHARLNPGTLKVTDAITGETLWREGDVVQFPKAGA